MKRIKNIILLFLGNAFLAFGMVAFALPANLIVGGVTGISLVIARITGINYTYYVYILNVIFFLLGFIYFGKKFALGTLLSTFLYPTFLTIFEQISAIKLITNDMLLSCIYAGICIGLGLGIVIREGYSTGGTDIPTMIFAKETGVNISASINGCDILILLSQVWFSSYPGVLYGIITVIITNYVMDKMLVLGESNYEVLIISDHYKEIVDSIYKNINRGVTYLKITTGYLKKESKAVMCVVDRRQLNALNKLTLEIDPEAFLVTNNCHSVNGRGFTLEDVDYNKSQA